MIEIYAAIPRVRRTGKLIDRQYILDSDGNFPSSNILHDDDTHTEEEVASTTEQLVRRIARKVLSCQFAGQGIEGRLLLPDQSGETIFASKPYPHDVELSPAQQDCHWVSYRFLAPNTRQALRSVVH